MTIVGVVRHVRYRTLEAQSRVQLYWPHAQTPSPFMSIAIHTSADPRGLAPLAQKEVMALDPDQPIYRVWAMQQLFSDSLARRRLSMLLLAIFAGLALLLAAVGIYGVMSYSVVQRRHEMGIRIALGARSTHLLGLVIGQSPSLALAGVAMALAGSLLVTRLISSLLFHVRPHDPSTLLLVAGVLTAVAVAASYLPARQAMLVDPINALRQE